MNEVHIRLIALPSQAQLSIFSTITFPVGEQYTSRTTATRPQIKDKDLAETLILAGI